jgi:Flp pilus assembly pilin Flp
VLIVVLVVVAALVALKLFGKQIKTMFESSTTTIQQETSNK